MLSKERPEPAFRGGSFSLANSAGHDQLLGGVSTTNRSGSKSNGLSIDDNQWTSSPRPQLEISPTANPPVLVVTEPSTTNSPTSSVSSREEIWPKTKEPNESYDDDPHRADIPLMRTKPPPENQKNVVTTDKFMDICSGVDIEPPKIPEITKPRNLDDYTFDDAEDLLNEKLNNYSNINNNDPGSVGSVDLVDYVDEIEKDLAKVCPRTGATGLSQSNTSIDSSPAYSYGNQTTEFMRGYNNSAYTSPPTRDKMPYHVPRTNSRQDTFELIENSPLVDPYISARSRQSLPALIGCEGIHAGSKKRRNRADSKPDVKTSTIDEMC